jgi:hypothetical protein
MLAFDVPAHTGLELVRFIRALGTHRYAASRRHDVHAFAWIAATAGRGDDGGPLAAGCAWAERALNDATIDRASRDERLHRAASDAELVGLLESFWVGAGRERSARVLTELLSSIGVDSGLSADGAFDPDGEADVFPVLVDAGWELLLLTQLDAERHKGAISALSTEDELGYAATRFEEESAIPPPAYLVELPLLGPRELLAGVDTGGAVRGEFAVWMQGPERYVDYIHRGVLRAAKLEIAD